MDQQQTCPYCQKEISAKATVCPYCRQWVNGKKLSLKNPYVIIGIVLVTFYFSTKLMSYYFLKKLGSKDIHFSPERKLKIISHQKISNKSGFRIVGEIRNDDDFKWDSIELEAVLNPEDKTKFALASTYVRDLKPQETKRFQIDSSCATGSAPDDFKTYDLKIESATAYLREK